MRLRYLILFPFLTTLVLSRTHAQDTDLLVDVYGGGTGLIGSSDYESSYYEDLRFGINYGGQLTYLIKNVGLGVHVDQSTFSATGGRLSAGQAIDEELKATFFGLAVTSKVDLNRESRLLFSLAYGQSVIDEEVVLNGDLFMQSRTEFVPKFRVQYHYKISDFSFICGIQFINEDPPSSRRNITRVGAAFPGSLSLNDPEVDFDRLSIYVGVSYSFQSIFL